ncbi:uncharacterized protein LTHEOB_10320 [Neofusicoccum parvum]|nr:uncharacterized protein LTHEOB_10320 [Neofusicoccum parvum]
MNSMALVPEFMLGVTDTREHDVLESKHVELDVPKDEHVEHDVLEDENAEDGVLDDNVSDTSEMTELTAQVLKDFATMDKSKPLTVRLWELEQEQRKKTPRLVETIDKFGSYKIIRFQDEEFAAFFAEIMDVKKVSTWATCVVGSIDVYQLHDLDGAYSRQDTSDFEEITDLEPITLGDWAKENIDGSLWSSLRKLLKHIQEHWVGPDKEYLGYELKIYTDKCVAGARPLTWHIDDYVVAYQTSGELDPSPVRIVTALKGPGTLFLQDRDAGHKHYDDDRYLDTLDKDQLALGELALYLPALQVPVWPEDMPAAIHSRPDNEDGDRIVVMIQLGTKRHMGGIMASHEEALEGSMWISAPALLPSIARRRQ